MKILFTGGSGLVGQEVKKFFENAYFPSSSELNLTDQNSINRYFKNNDFDYVVHLAAHVGSLHDNIKNRIDYFDKNIIMNTLLTRKCADLKVPNFLGILSSCVYPEDIDSFPIDEASLHHGVPHKSLLSYSYAKRSHALQIDNYRDVLDLNYNYLIPCNMYGKVSHKNSGRAHFLNDLVFKIVEAKRGDCQLTLFGDGTPYRQFMHARDFAAIIYRYIKNNLSESFNVAPAINITIKEYAERALRTLNLENIQIKFDSSLPNGQFRKDVCDKKFRKYFKDYQFISLSKGFRELYNFYESEK